MPRPILTRMLFGTCLASLAIISPICRAEMLQFSGADGVKSWPKLPDIADWHQDQELSMKQNANFLVPDGADPATADATIVARGYARSGGNTSSLSQLMDKDKSATPGSDVKKLADLYDKDSTPFTLVTYTPGAGQAGDWKAVAYSEEGEYLLAFTLDAHSKAGFDKNLPVFEALVQNYAKDIPW
jgi:hypothetical protein